MNPEQIFASLKKYTAQFSTGQLISMGLALAGVVGVVLLSTHYINKPDMVLLADGLDNESANQIVAKLKTAKVEYQLDNGGRTIRVPAEKVDELRLQVGADGIASNGHIGFEIFDKTSFGTTDTQERTNYQRALQGELERTIVSTISDIASARVNLTMPKDTLFSEQAQPAKAAVALKLKSNRPLPEQTVRAIAGTVANSVESLRPEAVIIIDNFGHVLTRNEDASATGLQLDKQQQVEKDLTTKLVTMLEPVVGPGRVRVNVAARLKADHEEETEERYDPTSVVRSRQTNTEADSRTMGQGGIAGARPNLPEGASAATPPATQPQVNGSSKNNETTNYEISRLTRHRVSPQGQLSRLSVAVIVDDEHAAVAPPAPGQPPAPPAKGTPRKPEEMQQIQKIVQAAMGFDQQRGDQLTVENIAFDAPADEAPAAPPTWKQTVSDYSKVYGMSAFRTFAVLVLALAAIFGVLRPMSKRAMSAPRELPAPIADRIRTIQEMEAAPAMGTPPVAIPIDAAHRLPSLSRQVARLANDEPEQLARIVRGWLAEEER